MKFFMGKIWLKADAAGVGKILRAHYRNVPESLLVDSAALIRDNRYLQIK